MPGHCILSHGYMSSPAANKVTALAQVAEALGWTHERPDYSDIDAGSDVRDVPRRLERLRQRAQESGKPLVLAGSSMGAYSSARVSLDVPLAGLFLIAPPVSLPGYPDVLDARPVPTRVVHGWHDELIPAQEVVDWCRERSLPLLLLDDDHRLERHVQLIAEEFARFLKTLA